MCEIVWMMESDVGGDVLAHSFKPCGGLCDDWWRAQRVRDREWFETLQKVAKRGVSSCDLDVWSTYASCNKRHLREFHRRTSFTRQPYSKRLLHFCQFTATG